MVISGAPQGSASTLEAFIELAKDPKGFEAKLNQLKAAQDAHDKAATRAQEAGEKAAQERARANAVIDEANAIMAGAKKAQASLEAEKQAHAEAVRTHKQNGDAELVQWAATRAALVDREKSAERREVALRAREGNLAKAEAAVTALREDLEAKLANLRKAVA